MSVLHEQFQALYDQHGELTAGLVVETAKQPEHPLHSFFEWDDSKAAEQHRIHQAQRLIRKVKIVYREANDTTPRRMGRAYLSVERAGRRVYEPTEEVVQDPLTAQMIMREMERDWQSLRRKYEGFKEFWVMINQDTDAA